MRQPDRQAPADRAADGMCVRLALHSLTCLVFRGLCLGRWCPVAVAPGPRWPRPLVRCAGSGAPGCRLVLRWLRSGRWVRRRGVPPLNDHSGTYGGKERRLVRRRLARLSLVSRLCPVLRVDGALRLILGCHRSTGSPSGSVPYVTTQRQ